MPRKKTTPKSLEELTAEVPSVETTDKPKPKAKAKPKAKEEEKFAFEVALVHGGGEHIVKLNDKKTLDKFVTNVTKRNLNAYPYMFTDDAGQTFILREFLFCRIVQNH
jgi:alpha-beta hydrolase superfamily lysophospholipase